MTAARAAKGLVALLMLVAPSAHAGDRDKADFVRDDSVASLDFGAGVIQPSLGGSIFSVLDTWNGQHTIYRTSGASLGVTRPLGWIVNATAHVYPFSFRGIGLVSTAEFGGFSSNLSTGSSPFGIVDTTNNSYWSVLVGPEAQIRYDSFFLRAGVLGGGRYSQVGDFSALEWRLALRGQLDWVVGNVKRGDTAFTVGLFGGADLWPALGWSGGLSLAVAFL